METKAGSERQTHDDLSHPAHGDPADGDPADGAAARALAEAEARRRARDPATVTLPPEIDGRAGPEPVRYGDWENKGIASDF